MKKNILITGVAGFIGSNVAQGCIRAGHKVYGIDNLSTGVLKNVPKEVEMLVGDINSPSDLDKIFSNEIDCVIHIAGNASIINSFNNPKSDLDTNLTGTINITEKCIQKNINKILYASSMVCYGNQETPFVVDKTPCVPVSYYGVSKYAAERYLMITSQRKDINLTVTAFRMFNVYGPKQSLTNPYQGVLGIFLGNLLRGESIKIYGDGKQTRDFVYIDDVVNAYLLGIEKNFNGVINVGSGKETSINDLANMVSKLNEQCKIERYEGRIGEQKNVSASIEESKQILAWIPWVELEDGLSQTFEWAKRNI